MVLFIGSMMNPNGLEIAANLAFVAALLRLRRDPTGFPGWAWISLIASGVVTVLAWQLGPFFAVVDIAAWAGLMGTRELRALYSRAWFAGAERRRDHDRGGRAVRRPTAAPPASFTRR